MKLEVHVACCGLLA